MGQIIYRVFTHPEAKAVRIMPRTNQHLARIRNNLDYQPEGGGGRMKGIDRSYSRRGFRGLKVKQKDGQV